MNLDHAIMITRSRKNGALTLSITLPISFDHKTVNAAMQLI